GAGSVKLIDGFSNATFNISHSPAASDPMSVGSPYSTQIEDTNEQISVRFRAVALDANEFFYIDDVKLIGTAVSLEPCDEGTLTAGTTTSNVTEVASGGSANLSLTDASTGTGLSYQWQSS